MNDNINILVNLSLGNLDNNNERLANGLANNRLVVLEPRLGFGNLTLSGVELLIEYIKTNIIVTGNIVVYLEDLVSCCKFSKLLISKLKELSNNIKYVIRNK